MQIYLFNLSHKLIAILLHKLIVLVLYCNVLCVVLCGVRYAVYVVFYDGLNVF